MSETSNPIQNQANSIVPASADAANTHGVKDAAPVPLVSPPKKDNVSPHVSTHL